jgi:hypothetical protein
VTDVAGKKRGGERGKLFFFAALLDEDMMGLIFKIKKYQDLLTTSL